MKKGSLLDIFPVMIIAFIVAIALFISYLVFIKIDNANIFEGDQDAENAMQQTDRAISAWDNLTIMIFLFLSMVTIVLASRIMSNPAWFFISLVLLIIAFIVAAAFSNAFGDVANNSAFSDVLPHFPKTQFLLDKLPFYVILMMFGIAISMYAGYKIG